MNNPPFPFQLLSHILLPECIASGFTYWWIKYTTQVQPKWIKTRTNNIYFKSYTSLSCLSIWNPIFPDGSRFCYDLNVLDIQVLTTEWREGACTKKKLCILQLFHWYLTIISLGQLGLVDIFQTTWSSSFRGKNSHSCCHAGHQQLRGKINHLKPRGLPEYSALTVPKFFHQLIAHNWLYDWYMKHVRFK